MLASRSETARGEWSAYKDRSSRNPIGSVAYKLALVAAGKADGTSPPRPRANGTSPRAPRCWPKRAA